MKAVGHLVDCCFFATWSFSRRAVAAISTPIRLPTWPPLTLAITCGFTLLYLMASKRYFTLVCPFGSWWSTCWLAVFIKTNAAWWSWTKDSREKFPVSFHFCVFRILFFLLKISSHLFDPVYCLHNAKYAARLSLFLWYDEIVSTFVIPRIASFNLK